MPTVVVLRHGETAWTRDEKVQGWAPVPLTERGREQAAALGERVADRYEVDRLLSSDLRRTRETAAAVAEAVGRDVEPDPDWRERNFGVYQGLTDAFFFGEYPEFSVERAGRDALERRPENGESWLDMTDRIVSAWEDLREEATGTVVVVTHSGPITALLGHLKGLDPMECITQSPGECSVAELEVTDEAVEIVFENDTGHL